MMLAVERDGTGPPLVLVHGFTQTGRCWGPMADDLARDHAVVRVDVPGHGRSSDIDADLPATADLLASLGPAAYLGYSMGGRMCLEMALRHPEVATGLVLVSATAGIDSDEDRPRRRAADNALADWIEKDGVDVFLDHWLSLPMFAGLPESGRFAGERRSNTPSGLASSLRLAGAGTQAPAWDRLHGLDMPVLVVAGELDAKFTILARRLVDGIGTNATLALMPEVGHTVHLEDSTTFDAILHPWLAANAL